MHEKVQKGNEKVRRDQLGTHQPAAALPHSVWPQLTSNPLGRTPIHSTFLWANIEQEGPASQFMIFGNLLPSDMDELCLGARHV